MKIALTTGEPAGIGPDIALTVANYEGNAEITLFGDTGTLAARAEELGCVNALSDLHIHHIPIAEPVRAGEPDPQNARYVLQQLDEAIDRCRQRDFDALVTAPINKAVICSGGFRFHGHTEYLGRACRVHPVMLFIADDMRIALLTTHLPLRNVADAVTSERLLETVRTVARDMRAYFGIRHPRIGVCGLNPHAGENGFLGREEVDIMRPVLSDLRNQGVAVSDPIPADTAFINSRLKEYDVFIGIYHDQVLPLIKHRCFDSAVNVTLGLPFPRTSVDHGSAFELAGSGRASAANLHTALRRAEQLALTHAAGT